MLAIFQQYNIPQMIQSHIYTFIKMKDEFNKVIEAIDTGIHEKQYIYSKIDLGYTNIFNLPAKARRITHAYDIFKLKYADVINKLKKQNNPLHIKLSNSYVYEPVGWPSPRTKIDPKTRCTYCNSQIKLNATGCNRCNITRQVAFQETILY